MCDPMSCRTGIYAPFAKYSHASFWKPYVLMGGGHTLSSLFYKGGRQAPQRSLGGGLQRRISEREGPLQKMLAASEEVDFWRCPQERDLVGETHTASNCHGDQGHVCVHVCPYLSIYVYIYTYIYIRIYIDKERERQRERQRDSETERKTKQHISLYIYIYTSIY